MIRDNPFKFKYNQGIWFLSHQYGFVQGKIKRVLFQHDEHNPGMLEYFVTCKRYSKEYTGDKRLENEIFLTKKEMINYYSKLSA